MDSIRIFFNPNNSNFTTINCLINNQQIDYTIHDNVISIECEIPFGIHSLQIKLTDDNQQLAIQDVSINHASIRMMLYLSYIIDSAGKIQQPMTSLWEKNQTWVLPFGNPVSFWISLVYQKINNGMLGTNLYEKFLIYYPTSLKLPDNYPTVVRTFFEHDFDFVVLPKDTPIKKLPLVPAELDIDLSLIESAAKEAEENRYWLGALAADIRQSAYDENDNWDQSKKWTRVHLYGPNKDILDQLPNIKKLIENLDFNIYSVNLGILPPGGSIAPHSDFTTYSDSNYDHEIDLYLYVPLNWPVGSFMKMNGAGIISDNTPHFVNVVDYTHSLVNNSQEYRTILGVMIYD